MNAKHRAALDDTMTAADLVNQSADSSPMGGRPVKVAFDAATARDLYAAMDRHVDERNGAFRFGGNRASDLRAWVVVMAAPTDAADLAMVQGMVDGTFEVAS